MTRDETRMTTHRCVIVMALLAACGPDGGADAGTGDADTGDQGPGGCTETAISSGIAGVTELRTCDIEGDCVEPEAGVEVLLFEGRSPQIGGGDLDPGMIDPTLPPSDQQSSNAGGRFEFAREQGDYFVCVLESADTILCSEMITVSASTPLWHARYEHGNGSSWSVDACVD